VLECNISADRSRVVSLCPGMYVWGCRRMHTVNDFAACMQCAQLPASDRLWYQDQPQAWALLTSTCDGADWASRQCRGVTNCDLHLWNLVNRESGSLLTDQHYCQ
jgi:hypothetical protein